MRWSVLLRWLWIPEGAYLGLCLLVFLVQRRMLYFPTRLSEDRALGLAKTQGLVLVTPMDSLRTVLRHHYPWLPSFLLRDRFASDTALRAYAGPAAFLLAGQDEVIPPALGQRLHAGYGGPDLLTGWSAAPRAGIRPGGGARSWSGPAVPPPGGCDAVAYPADPYFPFCLESPHVHLHP